MKRETGETSRLSSISSSSTENTRAKKPMAHKIEQGFRRFWKKGSVYKSEAEREEDRLSSISSSSTENTRAKKPMAHKIEQGFRRFWKKGSVYKSEAEREEEKKNSSQSSSVGSMVSMASSLNEATEKRKQNARQSLESQSDEEENPPIISEEESFKSLELPTTPGPDLVSPHDHTLSETHPDEKNKEKVQLQWTVKDDSLANEIQNVLQKHGYLFFIKVSKNNDLVIVTLETYLKKTEKQELILTINKLIEEKVQPQWTVKDESLANEIQKVLQTHKYSYSIKVSKNNDLFIVTLETYLKKTEKQELILTINKLIYEHDHKKYNFPAKSEHDANIIEKELISMLEKDDFDLLQEVIVYKENRNTQHPFSVHYPKPLTEEEADKLSQMLHSKIQEDQLRREETEKNTGLGLKRASHSSYFTLQALDKLIRDRKTIFAALAMFIIATGVLIALTYGATACPVIAAWLAPLAAGELLGITIATGFVAGTTALTLMGSAYSYGRSAFFKRLPDDVVTDKQSKSSEPPQRIEP